MSTTNTAATLSISIVSYHSNPEWLEETVRTLSDAVVTLKDSDAGASVELFLIENSATTQLEDFRADVAHRALLAQFCRVTIFSGHGNVGYGRGHNLALGAQSEFHLVLNPDVRLASDALKNALDFMTANPEVGLLVPSVADEHGQIQFLCRRYPSVETLAVRAFLPQTLRRFFATQLAAYEMRDVVRPGEILWDPPIVSGCFMFFRMELLRRLGGFDPRFFLYFEDYDLSLRAGRAAHVASVPTVQIVHYGGAAARKGSRHIRMFAASARQFFDLHGWKWLR